MEEPKTSPSKVYILRSHEELMGQLEAQRRKDAEPVDWDLEETKAKLRAFFGGGEQEPGVGGPGGSGETGRR